MHTIVLATQKGGSGKSTLSIGLALAAKQAGYSVRLIETDPQGTLSNWQRRRNNPDPVVEPIYRAADIEPRLRMLRESGLQLSIVDTAAGLSAATTAAIRHSSLCLIPTRPSVADIDTAMDALADEAPHDLADVLARPLIGMRNDHQDALAKGAAVTEYAPGSKAADEISGLWRWIEARFDLSPTPRARTIREFLAAPEMLPSVLAASRRVTLVS